MILYPTALAVLLVIVGVEKNPGPAVEAEKIFKFCVAVATEISIRELSVTRVEVSSLTSVVTLKLKWRREGNGSVINVERRDSGC